MQHGNGDSINNVKLAMIYNYMYNVPGGAFSSTGVIVVSTTTPVGCWREASWYGAPDWVVTTFWYWSWSTCINGIGYKQNKIMLFNMFAFITFL